MTLPPDRGHLATEHRHRESMDLDALSISACIELMANDAQRVPEAVSEAREPLAAFIEEVVAALREGGRLIYLGAGTSGRLGVLDASECPPTFQSDPGRVVGVIAGGDGSLRRSSEGREDDPDGAGADLAKLGVGPDDVVLGIAAGGTTPYVLGGIRLAREAGAVTGLLTCVQCKPPVPPVGCDHLILLDTRAELLTGSTRLKAGSATKLTLNIITTTAFVQLGKTYSNLMVDLRTTNDKLTDRALRILIEFAPELSRAEAARLLDEAGGHLKRAIVMERLGVDRFEAQRLLDEHEGHLRAVIGPAAAARKSASSRT